MGIKSGFSKAKNRIASEIRRLGDWYPIARMSGGRLTSKYSLVSKKRVSPQLARQLYYNSHDDYKLGGGLAKPIINTAVGFMGTPRMKVEDEEASEVLTSFMNENTSKTQRTHRNTLRDGRSYVRLTRSQLGYSALYPEKDAVLRYQILKPEEIQEVEKHVFTGEPIRYVIETTHQISDSTESTITQEITPDTIETSVRGEAPEGLEEGIADNPWGFIPIVEFNNEKESDQVEPRSDLEGVEPYIKAYHDVFLHAIQGSKLHSTPRLKMTVKDVAGFLQNNFGVTDPQKFIKEGRQIDLEDKDLLIFTEEGEDAEYIEVESAIGSAEPLLHLIFYCIVENSETPEFTFGAHLPANYASVREQMPVLIRKVSRKREAVNEPWSRLARCVLAMTSIAENRHFSTHQTELDWDTIDPRDSGEKAEELSNVVDALTDALDARIISHKTAVDYLRRFVEDMPAYAEDDEDRSERDRILQGIDELYPNGTDDGNGEIDPGNAFQAEVVELFEKYHTGTNNAREGGG